MSEPKGKRVAGGGRYAPGRWLAGLNRTQKILMVIVVILAVALLSVVACQSLFVRPDLPGQNVDDPAVPEDGDVKEETIDYGDGIRPKAEGERKSEDYYTVLILGRDTGGGGNTDTMLLASYDVTNQKATVMSIPRDTMVNVNWDVKKINSVYNMNGGGDKGVQAVYKEVAQLVGFEPDFKVVVEWEAVGKLVDAIGGVYFDVPYTMDYHDPYQDLVIEQEAGYRLLTGEDAMQVIRWRQNDSYSPYGNVKIGDDGRMKLQQEFLKAVIKQMMTPANVLNIGKIATVFQESVETDLSFQNILWFGQQAFSGGLSLDNVGFCTMPWKNASAFSRSYSKEFGRPHYLSYVVPIENELLQIVNESLSPFKDAFTRADLDIMGVNSDGSLRSSSGYVEDTAAASPPDLSPYESSQPETGGMGTGSGENVVVDPESGEIVVIDPEITEPEVQEPSGSGSQSSGGQSEPDNQSGSGSGQSSQLPAQPPVQEPEVVPPPTQSATPEPETPSEPEDFGFSVIEQPPAE